MNNRILKRIFLILLALSMLVAFGCAEENTEIPDENQEETVATAAPTEKPERQVKKVENATLKLSVAKYSSLNPLTTDNKDVITYMQLVAEPLYEFDSLKTIQSVLASNKTVSVDFKVWEIEILSNVQFGNEIFLTASDVVATYEYLLENPSNYEENVKNIAGVFEKDSKTVQFVLYEPDANLTEKLTVPILYEKSVTSDIPIGTGLFKVAEEGANNIMLTLNTVYRDETKKPQITSVDIGIYEKEYDKYVSDYDIGFIYGKNTAGFVIDGTKTCANYLGTTYYSVSVNTAATYRISETVNEEIKYLTFANPCTDVNVRKAINYLISRRDILNVSGAGQGKISLLPAYNGTSKQHFVYTDYENSTFLAEECLTNAGYSKNEDGLWTDGQGNFLTIKILALKSNEKICSMMRKIRDVLEENGITTEYEALFAEEYAARISDRNYMLVGTETELNGFSDIEKFFSSTGENNISAWQNEKVDEYIKNLRTISADDIYSAAFAKIEETVYEESPILGFYISSNTAVIGQNLYGVNPENFYSDNVFADFCNWYIVEDAE